MNQFSDTTRVDPAPRDMRTALLRGWRSRCPRCGSGQLYAGYLKVRPGCAFCGLDLSQQRADDAPSWLTILIVGHLLAPVILAAYEMFEMPLLAQVILWPSLAMLGVLLLLPRVKGAVIGFQWAQRMHGFDADETG